MTMADEMDPMGNVRQMSDFQISNNNNSLITNQNIPWKQRKRKRLSAVLDKLHNNNTITKKSLNELDAINEANNNNNQGEPSKASHIDFHRSVMSEAGRESVRSSGDDEDDRTTNASDDLRSSVESPFVKREPFGSPLSFAVNDENAFNGDIKQENRTSDYEYNHRAEQNVSPMERYFPQMPPQLFEYYLQTKYLPDILRMRNNIQVPNSELKVKIQPDQQQYSPQSQMAALDLQNKSIKVESTKPPPQKKQRQPKQQYQSFTEKPPPQDAPLDLSMKTILENITKATVTHKQIPRSPSSSSSSSVSTLANQWPAQAHDLSASIPNLANLLVNPAAHLNNHPAFTATHNQSSTSNNTLGQVPIIKGDVASPTTKESVAFRYNINVSPVVEEMPPGTDVAYVCPICGQMFSLHDRLAKHMASRHKSKSGTSEITKSYVCEVCERSFARSDMLTRHMRLHTGIKPYTCKVCNQVFSRSDHLSTHQRTHTGEKPYKCPQCPYAACRRDMITRHMRTHARYEAQRAAAAQAVAASNGNSIDVANTSANYQRNLIGKSNFFERNVFSTFKMNYFKQLIDSE